MQPQQPQQLDPSVVNLTKAIRQVESGGNLNARGGSGEFGGYQFTPDTWNAYASEAGVAVPLEQATREQQNEVAYKKIKQWKDQGYNVGQVASMWNAGQGRPNAYQENHRGVNSYGVEYDTPGYAEKVAQAYQQLKGGNLGGTYVQPPQTHDYTPATTSGVQSLQQELGIPEGGFIDQIGQDFSNLGQNINAATQNDYNIVSKALQTVGAGAGLVGDVIDTSLSNLPVVGGAYQAVTEGLGKFVSGGLEATGATDWMAEHPEAAGNIGAGLDILSVVPFLKALKFGKAGIRDAATAVGGSKVETGAANELKSSLTKPPTRTLNRAESRGLDPMGTIVRNQEYLPDIIESNGRFLYDTKQSTQAIQRAIDADEQALQNLLKSTVAKDPNAPGMAFNINDIAKKTIDDVLGATGRTGGYQGIKKALLDYFDSYKASMDGVEFVNLAELNDIKRDVRKAINFDAIDPTGTLAKEAKFEAGQSLMKQVEEAAKKAGIKEVKDLNQQMANNITAKDILEFLDQRPIKAGGVKNGLVTSVAKTIPGVEGLVDYATRGAPLTPTNRLKSRRPLPETGRKGLAQLGGGLALSGQLSQEQ